MVLVTLDVVTIVIYTKCTYLHGKRSIKSKPKCILICANLYNAGTYAYVPQFFFFCLVCTVACYTLSRKKDTKIIHGGIGSTWKRNFYMSTQNGSKNEI